MKLNEKKSKNTLLTQPFCFFGEALSLKQCAPNKVIVISIKVLTILKCMPRQETLVLLSLHHKIVFSDIMYKYATNTTILIQLQLL